MLKIDTLNFSYPKQAVIRELSATFEPGLHMVIGPNASGKSTLLKCIAGELKCEGRIQQGELVLARAQRKVWFDQLAYLPQDIATQSRLTVLETLVLGRVNTLRWHVTEADLAVVAKVAQQIGVNDWLDRPVCELSGGQQKLVAVGQVLAREPKILLLDEPSAALDLRHQFELFQLLQNICRTTDLTVLAAVHDLNLPLQFADSVLLLNGPDEWHFGPVTEMLVPEKLSPIYQVGIDIITAEDGECFIHTRAK